MAGSSSNPFEISDDDSMNVHYPIGREKKKSKVFLDPSLALSNNIKFRECREGEREVLQGAHLCLESIQGTNFLENQHVLEYLSKDLPTHKEKVEWFYRNVSIKSDFRKAEGERVVFKVVFPKTTLSYNDMNLFSDFGLISDGEKCASFAIWPSDKGIMKNGVGNEWLTARFLNQSDARITSQDTTANIEYMEGEDIIMEHVLRKCLLPTPNSSNICSRQSTLLLYMIKAKRLVNWPHVFANHILECGGTSKINFLPYGGLITHIVDSWKLRIPYTTIPSSIFLNSHYFAELDVYKVESWLIKFDDRNILDQRDRQIFDEVTKSFGLERGVHYFEDGEEEVSESDSE